MSNRSAERNRLSKLATAILAVAAVFMGTAPLTPAATRLAPRTPAPAPAAPQESSDAVAVPEACTPGNILLDGSFEAAAGNPLNSPNWTEGSTNFGSPLCTVALCTNGGGTATPRTGTKWSWFGGIDTVAETATMSQSVTFPTAEGTVMLNFWMRIGAVNTPFTDTLVVTIDGNQIASFTEPAVAEASYTLRTFNVSQFANGAAHTILFTYTHAAGVDDDISNFNVDDVTLDVTCGAPATAKDSIGLYASNVFLLRNTNDSGVANTTAGFGAAGDVPIKGDWNNDGTDTIGVYRPSTGDFFLKNTNTPGAPDISVQFGAVNASFVPLSGDWNNDNTDTIGLYDSATGTFFLKNTNTAGPADITFSFGPTGQGQIPLVGDWNNDGTDTIAIYIPSSGVFFLTNTNATGTASGVFTFGAGGLGYLPIAGDWNNDGTDGIGLYNPANGAFFLRNMPNLGSADISFTFGSGSQTPIAGDWDNLP